MFIRTEIKQPRPIAAQLGHTHALPKTLKAYAILTSFCLIIETTSTPYYKFDKRLSSLLQQLA